jgi:menaquinone-specific isochorismate synthase
MFEFITENTIAIQDIKKTVLAYLNSILGKEKNHHKVMRLALRIESIDFLAWLKGQSLDKKIYWNDKKDNFEVAGIGAADHVSGKDISDYSTVIQRILKYSSDKCSKCRYYGGFSFYKEEAGRDEWETFGAYNFVFPKFEMIRDADGELFVCNLIHPDENSLIQLAGDLEKISFKEKELKADLPGISEVTYWPGHDNWRDMINSALRDINEGEFDKIVLARKIEIDLLSRVDPFSILAVLRSSNHQTVSFCFQPGPETTFIGATPELLYRRDGRQINSEALAGTRPRGNNPEEDDKLARDLITDEKELREHFFVTRSLERNLGRLCPQLESNGRVSVLKLAQIQHLYVPFKGSLNPDVTDGDILESIHPTPAVGGYPDKSVLPILQATEPFNRGWYAAPIGWTAADSATFAVAIRSALVIKNKLILYSGAGIVEGSSPDKEWEELENKIYHFKKVLGVDGKSLEEYQQLLGLSAY